MQYLMYMPEKFFGTTELAELLNTSRQNVIYAVRNMPHAVRVGRSYGIAASKTLQFVATELEAEEVSRFQLIDVLDHLDEPDAAETYTAADLGRLLGMTRAGATLLVQREFGAEADGGNYAIPLEDVRRFIQGKIAQHEARIAHLQKSLAKLQEEEPAATE